MKKNMLYVGHEYHKKTHSVDFLIELFETKYNVDVITYDDQTKEFSGASHCFQKQYDHLVLFQMPILLSELKEKFTFDKITYFPMYDGTGEAPDEFWLDYKEFNIINFSKKLHDRLLEMGLSSYYLQYFPELRTISNYGDEKSIFFWQRRENINLHVVKELTKKGDIGHIHVHKAMDFSKEIDYETSDEVKYTFSSWYETREEMLQDMEKSAIYIAPREYEGIGMSFLEAMAMGRCVIAPNKPTMNEYIVDGENGYLYDLHNLKAINKIKTREMQDNVINYMKKGHEKWEKEKYEILSWIESNVCINEKKFQNTFLKNSNGKYTAFRAKLINKFFIKKLKKIYYFFK